MYLIPWLDVNKDDSIGVAILNKISFFGYHYGYVYATKCLFMLMREVVYLHKYI